MAVALTAGKVGPLAQASTLVTTIWEDRFMPWLGHAPDAPDDHRIWADPDTTHEAALRASGWCHEVPAPGAEPPENPPAEPVPAEPAPVVEHPAPEPTKRGGRG